jgi:iron(III) transport system ATP-binding protein
VLNAGKLVQIGTPGELYHRPATRFVADFIGNTNLLDGRVIEQRDGVARVETAVGILSAKSSKPLPDRVTVSVRPEQMEMTSREEASGGRANRLTGRIVETTFLGEASEHVLLVNNQNLRVVSAPPVFDPPEQMTVAFDAEDVVVLTE